MPTTPKLFKPVLPLLLLSAGAAWPPTPSRRSIRVTPPG